VDGKKRERETFKHLKSGKPSGIMRWQREGEERERVSSITHKGKGD
jgi:hypothetical protein